MASLGMVFEQYPSDVVEYVTNPQTGVQRAKTFPPSIAEIVAACDTRVASLRQRDRFRNWGKNDAEALLEGPREARPSYAELKAKYGENWGIGGDPEAPRDVRPQAMNAEQLAEHYKHFGLAFKPKATGERLPSKTEGAA